MKKLALAVSVLAAATGLASAADMPVKAPPIVAAGLDWSGVYVGAHAGYGGGQKDWLGQASFVARGPLLGGQVGINKQLGSFVVGVELDGSWADIKKTQYDFLGGVPLGLTIDSFTTSKIDSIATFAGRAGIAADRWFVFAKAGLSAVHEKHALAITVTGGVPVSVTASGSETRYAPMLGFGAEYAFSGPWSVLAEYNYHHLGDRTVRITGAVNNAGVVTPFVFDQGINQAIHVAKLGVNYRFGGVAIDPSYAPVPPAPGTNWSGAWVGAQGGYGWGKQQSPDFLGIAVQQLRYDLSGWLAGGSVGVNAQAGRFVFGVEGEILATDIKGSVTGTFPVPGGPVATQTLSNKIDWLALATARAGFTVGDKLLVYGKGGIAIAEESYIVSGTNGLPVATFNATGKAISTGVVIGAGGEYAIAPNWSIKAEYNYIKMFAQSVLAKGTAVGGNFGTGAALFFPFDKTEQDLHLVKFGVNYHFNPQPVVVARY